MLIRQLRHLIDSGTTRREWCARALLGTNGASGGALHWSQPGCGRRSTRDGGKESTTRRGKAKFKIPISDRAWANLCAGGAPAAGLDAGGRSCPAEGRRCTRSPLPLAWPQAYGPNGERNGAYRTAHYTAGTKAERRRVRTVIRVLRHLIHSGD
jgi:hypothetical protein